MSVASRDSGNSIKDTTAGDDKEKGTNKPKTNLQKQYQEEHQGTGSVPWRVYMFYFKNMGLMMFAGCFLMYAVFQTFTVMSSIWVSFWSDNRFPLEEALEDRIMTTSRRNIFLGVYGACGLAQALGAVLASIMLYTASVRGGRGLHQKMLHSVIHAPMTFFDTTPQGRILNRFSKDVDVLDTTMPNILRGWMTRMLTVVSTFLVIMVATPLAIIPIFVVMCGYYFVLKVYVSVSRQLKRVESTTRSPIYSHFGETISGAATIRAYGRQGEFVRESERRVDRNHQATFCSNVANRWLAVRLEAVGNIIVFAAALFSVLGRDSLSPGLVGLSVSYALQVTTTLNWLVRVTSDLESNVVAVERLEEFSHLQPEAAWDTDTELPGGWPGHGEISLEDYSTRYREGLDLVLQGVTATLQPGERIGVVGRTGAGKSSLTLALFRLLEPVTGRISIDGVDISRLGLHQLRSRLTIIPQDPVLFSGSLRHNLDPGHQHEDAEVWAALRQAHLATFVSSLRAGLDHEVAEAGDNLSVGQRQLICLARALLRKTKILVLDEATAAVDLETDNLIQETIRAEFQGCTIVTIAHRLNTVLDYDRVLVLRDGAITELDSPRALLATEGSEFRAMCQDARLV